MGAGGAALCSTGRKESKFPVRLLHGIDGLDLSWLTTVCSCPGLAISILCPPELDLTSSSNRVADQLCGLGIELDPGFEGLLSCAFRYSISFSRASTFLANNIF
jgi:hypothetical protein